MEVFLYYVYKDELDSRLDAELAAVVLHIAQYYGAPRLAGLCERLLAREIKIGDPEDEGVPSPALLPSVHLRSHVYLRSRVLTLQVTIALIIC